MKETDKNVSRTKEELPSEDKGLDETFYYLDAENSKHAELIAEFKKLVRQATGCEFRKIMVMTVDDEGKVRPLFIDPAKGRRGMKTCCVSGSDSAFIGQNPYKGEQKILLRQNVISITTHMENPDIVCWPNIQGIWECVKI
jgi:hypothetical protein